jgi:hypothetical protein
VRPPLAVLAVLAAAIAWIVYDRVADYGRPVAWRDITQSLRGLEFDQPQTLVFRHAADLRRELRPAPPRGVDLGREQIVLVGAGPRSSPSYRLEIVDVVERREEVVVSVRERTPALREHVRATLSFPYRALVVARSRKHVVANWLGR